MATIAETLKSEKSINRRVSITVAVLLGLAVVSGWLFSVNYWVGLICAFSGGVIFIHLRLDEYQQRGLWLVVAAGLFVATLTGSLALTFRPNNPSLHPLAQGDGLAQIFSGSDPAIILTAVLLGVAAALVLVVLPLLALVAVATAGILKWHKKDEQISFGAAFWYLLTTLLGVFRFSVSVDNLELKGSDQDRERLEFFGGPGWLKVYPGQVVVLHRWGKITRAVGVGSTMLKSEEQVKTVLPLTARDESYVLEKVLTQDQVPVRISVTYTVQLEAAAETKNRLSNQAGDQLIGDEYDQCYEKVACMVAAKSPDIWGSMKDIITKTVREVFRSYTLNELCRPGRGNQNLGVSLNKRKIAEIETTVLERVRDSGRDKRALLKAVELMVEVPDEAKVSLNEQVTAWLKAKIEQHEAQARELSAAYEAQARQSKAKSKRSAAGKTPPTGDLAKAKAQAEALQAEAKAEYYRQVRQLLQQQSQADAAAGAALQNLAASTSPEDELKRLLGSIGPNGYATPTRIPPPESRPV